MPTHYIIEADTLAGIAGAIREKTGDYSPIRVVDMEDRIYGIQTGGSGTIEGAHTVTFMSEDGQTVLGTKPVMNGDTCGDPITLGLFETPTKESTAQYEYTFNGWSTTAGGDADSNALVNVTENRTVYASFASSTIKYTVNFYDGETLLETQQVAYGTMPSYSSGTPEKTGGYIFIGWTPEIVVVTGDADYYVEWSTDTSALFPLQEITMVYDEYGTKGYISNSPYTYIDVTDGEKYLVTWDGVDYVCEARSIWFKGSVTKTTKELTLGNPFQFKTLFTGAISERRLKDQDGELLTNDGVPFFIETNGYVGNSKGYLVVHTTNTSATHTLRIGTLE